MCSSRLALLLPIRTTSRREGRPCAVVFPPGRVGSRSRHPRFLPECPHCERCGDAPVRLQAQVDLWDKLPRMLPLDLPARALALARLGRTDEALKAAANLEGLSPPAALCVWLALLYESAVTAAPSDPANPTVATDSVVNWLTREEAGYFRFVANRALLNGPRFSRMVGNPSFERLREPLDSANSGAKGKEPVTPKGRPSQ